ncbi:MAG: type III PLP-dependent enzyme [Trebonia sp.]
MQLNSFKDFVTRNSPPTPFIAVDLDVVARKHAELADAFPEAVSYYAVKANPHPDVIATLRDLGSSFDVASRAEIELCLGLGVDPGRISFGNTIKKPEDIAYAAARGVGLYAFDSEAEVRKIAAIAPGASALCRILVSSDGAQWPLSRKFGCDPAMAVDLLLLAAELGLRPTGVSFHVGSQQLRPESWDAGLEGAASLFGQAHARGVDLSTVNLGGGLPANYGPEVPALGEYAKAIHDSLGNRFPGRTPNLMIEPGRFIVADAGILRSRVLLISTKSYDARERWVYLDIGRFGGLAETENEAIEYPLAYGDGFAAEVGPVILAGPTCDSADILYERKPRYLSLGLRIGDHIDFLSCGAYTATYASVGFNGIPPVDTYCYRGGT